MAKQKVPADNPRGLLEYTNALGKRALNRKNEMAELQSKMEILSKQAEQDTWPKAIDRLRADLEYLVGRKRVGIAGGGTLPGRGTVEVLGPCGLGCTIHITVRPTTRHADRHISVRPVGIGTPDFHLAIVNDKATSCSPPGSIAAINGLDYRATTPVRSARHLLRVMERRFKQRKTNNHADQ